MTQPPRILIHNNDTNGMSERLSQAVPDVEVTTCNSYGELPAVVEKFRPDAVYSICFQGRSGFPREALLEGNGPSWVSVGGSGVDHLATWDTDKVTVTNSAGVAAAMMAEYAFGAMLHFTLDITGLNADKVNRHWNSGRLMLPLHGKTMLIVGLGHTGQAVAARAKAFGMHVIGTRARPADMDNVDEVHASEALPDLWERADFIVLSVPLLPSTRDLVDARAFAAMKPSAVLIDVSRGGVLNGAALTNAMRNQAIAGAALDVFDPEPLDPSSPIWDLENVIISPHCSSVYEGWNNASFEMFIENIARWRSGETLNNIVSPKRGY